MRFVSLFLGLVLSVVLGVCHGQTIVDVNQAPLNFDQPIVLDAGNGATNGGDDDDDDDDDNGGSSAIGEGAVLLYEDIFNEGGVVFDALVTFASIDGGVCSDYDNTSSTQNNIPRWFSPRFTWNSGGGQAVIDIAFIASGSANAPIAVAFDEFLLNSYDLDGGVISSGAAGQFTDLEQFESFTLGENSTLTVSEIEGFTRFQSAFNQATDADSDETRVYARFGEVSNMSLRLGASGSGLAYYFLDFSEGLTWVTEPDPELNEFEATCAGSELTLTGDFLESVTGIAIGDVAVDAFDILNDNEIALVIPEGVSEGEVDVTLTAYGESFVFSGLNILVLDECGVCGGEGIAEGECDCDGNVLDECGMCGGEGIAEGACDCDGNVLDECGVCGGDGIAEGACDCDGTLIDECGVCGGEGGTTWYADVDGDGKGDCEEVLVSCEQPEGYVLECGDACPEDPSKYDPGFCGCGMVEFFAHGEVVCAEICCPDGDCPGPEDLCGLGTVWDPDCQQCICTSPTCYGDINLDGVIQLNDLLDLLGVYGTSCDDE